MNLRELREKHGLSQQALAEKVRLTQLTISRYERGETTPPYSFWFLLAHLFGIDPSEIK